MTRPFSEFRAEIHAKLRAEQGWLRYWWGRLRSRVMVYWRLRLHYWLHPEALRPVSQEAFDAVARDSAQKDIPSCMTSRPQDTGASARCESRCDDCGGVNPVWFAPNAVWNLVIGGPDAKGDPGGFVCPNCFIARAEAKGVVPTAWELRPEAL